jgi:hypothetical protein
MMLRAAIALMALAAPAFAQHGGGHGGSVGGRGSSGHAGFSGSSGFSGARSFAAPAAPVRYGAFGGPGSVGGFRGAVAPRSPGYRIPYTGNRFVAARPLSYGQPRAGVVRTVNRSEIDARAQFNARRRSFDHWYLYSYPTWPGYGYPWVIDPGFYDWGDDYGTPAYDQGGAVASPALYPDEENAAPAEQAIASARVAIPAPPPEQPLTVIFRDGRPPVKMQNYMMTSKVLIDLDSQHYQQIPLDQVDEAATQRANSAEGVDFQIPGASRD